MVLLQKTSFFRWSLDSQDLPDRYCFAFWYGFFAGDFWHIFFYKRKIQVYLQLLGTFKLEEMHAVVSDGKPRPHHFLATEKKIGPSLGGFKIPW